MNAIADFIVGDVVVGLEVEIDLEPSLAGRDGLRNSCLGRLAGFALGEIEDGRSSIDLPFCCLLSSFTVGDTLKDLWKKVKHFLQLFLASTSISLPSQREWLRGE